MIALAGNYLFWWRIKSAYLKKLFTEVIFIFISYVLLFSLYYYMTVREYIVTAEYRIQDNEIILYDYMITRAIHNDNIQFKNDCVERYIL